MTDREALQIAFNALVAIDRETPYPIAKHAIKCINVAFNTAQDIEAAVLAEREACAKVCMDYYYDIGGSCKDAALAIRMRGDKHD